MLDWTLIDDTVPNVAWQAHHGTGAWSISFGRDRSFRIRLTTPGLLTAEVGQASTLPDAQTLVANLLRPQERDFEALLEMLSFKHTSSFTSERGIVDLYRSKHVKGHDLIIAPNHIALELGAKKAKTILRLNDPLKAEQPFAYPKGIVDYRAAALRALMEMLVGMEVAA